VTEDDEVRRAFRDAVNMTPKELEHWLGSRESKSVGVTGDQEDLAQRPHSEPIKDSRWRYSLMNWGHDPLKN
jgi:uncharacterized protein DUF3140